MKDIIATLHTNNKKVYYVGGAVRDRLSNVEPEDIDLTTDATPEELVCLFSHRKVGLVGATFGVVLVDGIEVATFRKDIYHKAGFKVTYTDKIEEDLARRDLTINAMAIDCKTNEIADPFNGKADLKDEVIRFVGNGEHRIKEDPCRILRACRFLAKLEGSFHPDTFKALVDNVELLKSVPPERMRLELLKAMKVKTPSLFFSSLHLIGGLRYVCPALETCTTIPHGLHHVETIFEHSMLAGDYIHPKFPLLRLAAFLHDIGKPEAYRICGDGSFKGHEAIGAILAKTTLKRLCFTNEEIETVTGLIRLHMRPIRNLRAPAARRLQKAMYDYKVDGRDLIRIKLADHTANVRKASKINPKFVRDMLKNTGVYKTEEELPFTVNSLKLKGGEIINEFNLKPGPLVGQIQRHLLSYVIENGEEFNDYNLLTKEVENFLGD